MHRFILVFQYICDTLNCYVTTVKKSKNLIKNQKIAFLSNNNFTGKIQSVQNVGILLCLFFFCQVFVSAFSLFEAKDLIIQVVHILQEIQRTLVSSYQKLDHDHAFALCSHTETLSDSQCSLAFAVSGRDVNISFR